MKNTKRFLIVLLTLSLLLSCFAIGASAYTASVENYQEVLELFETTEFVNADFDGFTGNSYTEAFANKHQDFVITGLDSTSPTFVSDNVGDYLKVTQKSALSFKLAPSEEMNYGLNFSLCFPSVSSGALSKVNLDVVDSEVKKSIFMISGEEIKTWSGVSQAGLDQYLTFDNLTFSANVFYDFSVFCVKTNSGSKINITVTDRANGTAVNLPEFYIKDFNTESLTISLPTSRSGKSYATTYIGYINAYEGSFVRDLRTKDTDVAKYIKEIYALYTADTESSYAFNILDTINKVVVTYGYKTDNVSDNDLKTATDAAITSALKIQGDVYAAALINEIGSIDSVNSTYNERLDTANKLSVYSVLIDWILTNRTDIALSSSTADIQLAKTALDAEIATLAKLESDTLACIEAVNSIGDPNLADYKTLYSVNSTVTNAQVCMTYTSETVTSEQVRAAADACEVIKFRFSVLDNNAKDFVKNVRIARDTEKTFLERYNAYIAIRDIVFVDNSYDDFIEGGVDTVAGLNLDFIAVDAEMRVAVELATEFLSKISTAESSNSFNVKADALKEATVIMQSDEFATIDGENGYPGILEAKSKHTELLAAITTSETNAKTYIEAVIAIKNATTFAEKKAAIEAAKALSAGVDNVTINVTVTETISETETKEVDVKDANIRLSAADAEVKLIELNAANFKSAIAAYKAAKTTADRRAALIEANALMQVANDVIDGVAAAKTECNAAIAAYNAEVEAANTVAAKANTIAANVAEGAVSAAPGAKVIAIIKKFYE